MVNMSNGPNQLPYTSPEDIIPATQAEVNQLGPTEPWQNPTPLEASAYLMAYNSTRRFLKVEEVRREHAVDATTGLFTETAWERQVNWRLATATPDESFGVIYIDLKDFKAVNDSHPLKHDGGDGVLREIASLLRSSVRTEGTDPDLVTRHAPIVEGQAAHLHGDEFIIFAEISGSEHNPGDAAINLEKYVKRLEALFREYLDYHPQLAAWGLDFSIGAVVRLPGESAKSLKARADAAMYLHKATQKRREGGHH